MLAFMVLFVLLMGFLVWVGETSRKNEAALAREVRQFETSEPFRDLLGCLGWELSLARNWDDHGTGVWSFNGVKKLGVQVYDLGPARKVVITTRRGRLLRPSEIATLSRCGLK